LNTFLIIIALGYTIQCSINQLDKINKNSKFYGDFKYGRFEELIKDIKFISELKGQFYSNPLLSLSFTVCLFSMAGVPPLIGFFSKQFVLYSAIQNGFYFMSFVAILVSVISASYYLKIIRVLHTEEEDIIQDENLTNTLKYEEETWDTIKDSNLINKNHKNENFSESLLTNFHSFLISTLTLTILLFVLKPSIILNITQLLSLSLYNF
jgi:NADH-ubiquinone oxidoreductase chain 2